MMEVISVKELSEQLGISVDVARAILADNNVPCVEIGELAHRIYVDKQKVVELFDKQNVSLKDRIHERRKKSRERCREWYNENKEKEIQKQIKRNDEKNNTHGRRGHKRGNSGALKRDEELSLFQLSKRNKKREENGRGKKKMYSVLVWYSGKLEELSTKEYRRIMQTEYKRQFRAAVTGRKSNRVIETENFLFDFDLERMYEDKVSDHGNIIEKWWPGTIRHWTVKDGIWRK